MKTVSAESDLVWNFWFCQNVFFGRQSFKSVITARSVSIVFRPTTKDFTTFLSTIVDWESSSWQSCCLNFIAGVCFFFFFLATNLHVTTRMIQFIEAQREFHCKNTERLEDPCLICWSFSRRQVLQIFCHLFLYFARQQDSQDHERIHLVRTTGRSVRILASLTYSSCLAN